MYLKHLRVSGFRNLTEQSIEFSPGITFICGRNGEGKTNLLEAIYVLSLSKSYRTSKQQELINWGSEKSAIFGVVRDSLNETKLAVGIEKGKRELLVNDERVDSILKYLGHLTTIAFSPSDLALIKGGPSLRRKFIDKHINDLKPTTMQHFLSYNKALANKSVLLAQNDVDRRALDSWNVIMAQSASIILEERYSLLKKLEEELRHEENRIGLCDGEVELKLDTNIAEEFLSKDWKTLFEFYKKVSYQELSKRRAIFGPHRDELIIRLGGVDSRAFASQGQTRSLVLSLKFALLRLIEEGKGESPVLLLDDVDSELDSERREALFEAIFSKERQVIITGTNHSALSAKDTKDIQFLGLNQGKIQSISC
ncbi:MAG: DNA replication/repair protein RecF [SAR324 cluster bacterium]|uniref:DNA replication and repair protein RecF n=1 Tax=SAR324 cluster bacterium TaxID=2024889 RepID=A0A7X9IMN0_9DELT|nr:DNA replication/repair protein RecF [SAR324 cluster bacterium]